MTIADLPEKLPPYRFTRAMYDQMVELGILEDQHVEFIDGEIVQMSPIDNPHVTSCTLLTDLLRQAFGKGFHLRVQAPLSVRDSAPQPDIAVISGHPRDYKNYPSTAALVVEVADSSVRYDRGVKASLYASGMLPEYWVLNVKASQLEVFRTPIADLGQRFGHKFQDVRVFGKDESVVPLNAAKAAGILVADMLP